jgi:hypothetical protein
MDRIFNSIFENTLRLLILLDEYDMPQTLDMLYAVDFMAMYGQPFGISDHNLHGDNDLKYSEFISQRELVKEALKELVLDNTAEAVSYKNGLSYIITSEGEDYCKSLNSEYAFEYRKLARKVINASEGKSERTLIATIYRLSEKSINKEVKQ